MLPGVTVRSRALVPFIPELANQFVHIGYALGFGSLRSGRTVHCFQLSLGVRDGIYTQLLPLDVESLLAEGFLGLFDEIWPMITCPSNFNLLQSGVKTIP